MPSGGLEMSWDRAERQLRAYPDTRPSFLGPLTSLRKAHLQGDGQPGKSGVMSCSENTDLYKNVTRFR